MPCRHETDYDALVNANRALDRATRLLCKMVAHFGVIPGDEELAAWKTAHDEQDRRRLAAERAKQERREAEKRRAVLVQQAASKLTPEEIEALKRTP